jgi:hypothetical protein
MFRKAFWAIFGVGLAFCLMAIVPQARADSWDQSMRLTFSEPFQLPGNQVLPAGTYWFEVRSDLAPTSDVVQIMDKDRTKIVGVFLTVSTRREQRTTDAELRFAEPAAGQPAALLSWFYPGNFAGHRFVYPPREEAKLSASMHVTVDARNPS